MIRQTDPVDEYFMKVRDKWDGKTDHIAMLAQAVQCNIPQWEKWFRKWFLYMVAQWLGRVQDFGNSIVPLLISSQGDGKSTFCQNLLPKELRWGYLANLDVNEKKQTLQAMHNFLLINLDEFNQISPKIQEGFLKNVIQLPSVKMKRPYGKHVEDFKRMASFIATTNEVNVLSDSTGNRRFICVQLKAPINTKNKPNYEALYSQAYQLVMKGEQYWFNAEEIKEVMAHNRQYEIVPPAMMYFNEYYEVAPNETEGKWTSPTAIYDHLRKIAGASLKANGVSAFGKYLKNIPGLQQKRINKGIFYLVREK
jgi:predicted P-loop ATPase